MLRRLPAAASSISHGALSLSSLWSSLSSSPVRAASVQVGVAANSQGDTASGRQGRRRSILNKPPKFDISADAESANDTNTKKLAPTSPPGAEPIANIFTPSEKKATRKVRPAKKKESVSRTPWKPAPALAVSPIVIPDNFAALIPPPDILHPDLARNLERMGIVSPLEIQARTIPPFLAGHDIIMTAETGSGKTLAFLFPIVHKLLNDYHQKKTSSNNTANLVTKKENKNGSSPRALILVHNQTLANQVDIVLRHLLRDLPIRHKTMHKIMARSEQVDIIVSTPQAIIDAVRWRRHIENLEMIVMDEVDLLFGECMGNRPLTSLMRFLLARRLERKKVASSSSSSTSSSLAQPGSTVPTENKGESEKSPTQNSSVSSESYLQQKEQQAQESQQPKMQENDSPSSILSSASGSSSSKQTTSTKTKKPEVLATRKKQFVFAGATIPTRFKRSSFSFIVSHIPEVARISNMRAHSVPVNLRTKFIRTPSTATEKGLNYCLNILRNCLDAPLNKDDKDDTKSSDMDHQEEHHQSQQKKAINLDPPAVTIVFTNSADECDRLAAFLKRMYSSASSDGRKENQKAQQRIDPAPMSMQCEIFKLNRNVPDDEREDILYELTRISSSSKTATCENSASTKTIGDLLSGSSNNNNDIINQRKKVTVPAPRKRAVLVATDWASRGIDFKAGRVVHWNMAKTTVNFLHRCGRTARGGMSGEAIMLVSPENEFLASLLEKLLQKSSGDVNAPKSLESIFSRNRSLMKKQGAKKMKQNLISQRTE